MASQTTATQLSASYSSPSESQTFKLPLPTSPPEQDVQAKTTYLSSLRAQTGQLQSQINAYLTSKMEEEKQEANSSTLLSGSKPSRDEEREEQMYGEEDSGE